MEMPILGLMIPKKNAAVCNGITIVLYEMEGCNMAPKFKGFLPRFPRWAVYEMMLVFPFHTGHGFFHSIQVQSRGIIYAVILQMLVVFTMLFVVDKCTVVQRVTREIPKEYITKMQFLIEKSCSNASQK